MMRLKRIVFLLLLTSVQLGWTAEEDINLDKMTEASAPAVIPKSSETKFTIMGRVDLTAEVTPIKSKNADNKSELKDLHGLKLFLKVKASPKTSFMGEFVGESFYYIDYKNSESFSVNLGKIIVPFGDTRYFHHFYGGIQGFGGEGVMFQNIWAEPGVNFQTLLTPKTNLDLYVVNGFKADTNSSFPDLKSRAQSEGQAVGTRLQWQGLEKITLIGSGYFDYYWEKRSLILVGADIYTDYGLLPLPLRFAAGIADGAAENIPNEGTLHRRSDFIQIAGTNLGPGEWRIRYGTYNHITKTPSADDSHSFDLGYSFNVDVMKVLIERQWNFETKNEIENDLARVMVSLDF